MTGRLAVAGENIPAESAVVLALIGGKVWIAGQHAGEYVGQATESIREGFRVCINDATGEVREDDA